MLRVPENISNAAKKFRDALLKEKEIIIYHDTDQDGIVAGALLQDLLERHGIKVKALAADRDAIKFEPGKVYVLADIRISDKIAKDAEEKGIRLYYIDHHEPDALPKGAIILNPHMLNNINEDPFRWNTGLLAWIVREMDESSEWKAAAAHWADHSIGRHSEEWIKHVYDKYGEDTIVEAARRMGLAEHFPDRITENDVREIVKCAQHPKEILEHPTLKELNEIFRREFDRLSKEIQEHPLLKTEKLVYHIIESSVYKIKSPLATVLSDGDPDKIWIIGQEENGMINYSLRCQNATKLGIHLGEIAKEAAREFGGRGGGHPPAAGLRIPKEKEPEFREWIKRKIK